MEVSYAFLNDLAWIVLLYRVLLFNDVDKEIQAMSNVKHFLNEHFRTLLIRKGHTLGVWDSNVVVNKAGDFTVSTV